MIAPIEQQRLDVQKVLDAAKTPAERNRLGQFATPRVLAADILTYAKTILPRHEKVRFLDPAFGTGSFYSALLVAFPESRIDSATGFEIDPHYGLQALDLWKSTPLRLALKDFTKADPPAEEGKRANLVICNPPYVRHHHMDARDKVRLRHLAAKSAGVDMNGLSGLYCYFMGLTHAWMAKDAVAIWLIPSEFMDVNYGQPVKDYLLDRVTLLRIHRFDPADVQFDDALVSSAVVCFKNTTPAHPHKTEFTFGGSLLTPRTRVDIPEKTLRESKKWTGLVFASCAHETGTVRISDLFTIRRGIATGSNEFFVLPKDVAEKLPRQFLRPILPSPRYLDEDCVEADAFGNPILKKQLFLLDCRWPEHDLKAAYPALWHYLQTGKTAGVDKGYLCQHREPWYSQESREPAPFLCTYMGRKDKDNSAFRFIFNKSKAIAANVYLLLYPKPALAKAIKDDPRLAQEVWKALNRIPAASLIGAGRVYGGGLHKLEPKELAEAPAGEIIKALPKGFKVASGLFD